MDTDTVDWEKKTLYKQFGAMTKFARMGAKKLLLMMTPVCRMKLETSYRWSERTSFENHCKINLMEKVTPNEFHKILNAAIAAVRNPTKYKFPLDSTKRYPKFRKNIPTKLTNGNTT